MMLFLFLFSTAFAQDNDLISDQYRALEMLNVAEVMVNQNFSPYSFPTLNEIRTLRDFISYHNVNFVSLQVCDTTEIARVYPNFFLDTIFLCPLYYYQDQDEKAETILHEVSHLSLETTDDELGRHSAYELTARIVRMNIAYDLKQTLNGTN